MDKLRITASWTADGLIFNIIHTSRCTCFYIIIVVVVIVVVVIVDGRCLLDCPNLLLYNLFSSEAPFSFFLFFFFNHGKGYIVKETISQNMNTEMWLLPKTKYEKR